MELMCIRNTFGAPKAIGAAATKSSEGGGMERFSTKVVSATVRETSKQCVFYATNAQVCLRREISTSVRRQIVRTWIGIHFPHPSNRCVSFTLQYITHGIC
jgi:hypothetical protein